VTDHEHPVSAPNGVRLIELDEAQRIQHEFFAHLPTDRAQAAIVARQRLQAGGVDLQRRLAVAFQAMTDAWRVGIAKIPAVVVDERYVVYGQTNVALALSWIADYRRTHP
jgi:integrating conjugative element protein (TIGR03757 family)